MAAPEIAIILGAGASCAEGAPSQQNLFTTYFHNAAERARHGASDDMDRELATFFNEFFGIDVDSDAPQKAFPTFEEALGILELAITRTECFRGFQEQTVGILPARLSTSREFLILLIAATLDRALQHEGAHHRQLTRTLADYQFAKDTCFISFNYDILIDNALLELRETHDLDLDYGLEFQNFGEQWQRPRPDSSVKLLKLHGSLNWLYCPSCRALNLTPKEKGICHLITDPGQCKCSSCSTLSIPIIIPPTYFKVLSNLHLQIAWDHAEKALATAKTWVFCGYSFPDADIHVKYLLKRAEINSPKHRDVLILNWHEGKDSSLQREEHNRYQRFFGPYSTIHMPRLGFEDLASRPEATLLPHSEAIRAAFAKRRKA